MKRTVVFYLLAIVFIIVSNTYAQTPEIINGLNYLNSTQNTDGSWGDDTTGAQTVPSTTSVVETMNALDETGSQNYADAVSWLQGQALDTTGYISERMHVLSAAGTDQDILISYIDNIYTEAWGGYEDYDVNTLDTILALQALQTVGYSDLEAIGYALSYLIDSQNADGGFGLYFEDDSSTYVTALVLNVFASLNGTFDLQDEINNAAAYLLTKQNADGGFGSSPSTVHETAFAFISLVQSGQGQAQPMQDALNYVQTSQQPDGSWNDDPYSTALALRVLDNVKPDLSVSAPDITFSNAAPAEGEMVAINALIHNEGPVSASNVLVRFYDGDPDAGGVQIGSDQTIGSIAPYGSAPAEITYSTAGGAGSHAIFVTVDPLDQTDELNENDNRASRNLTVISIADFYVDSGEISFVPVNPTSDEDLEISFFIRNLGEKKENNVMARLFEGPPQSGQLLLEYTLGELKGNSGVFLIATIFNPDPGVHSYYLFVDPGNSVAESDESNNTGSVTVIVDGTQAEDLSIFPSNISFSPASGIEPGLDITINAVVNNTGSKNTTTDVAFYDSDPAQGGNLIDTRTITVPALGTSIAQVPWTIPVGPVMVFVVVDPDDIVFETDEANNTAYRSPYSSIPDFRVRDAGIVSYPSHPTPNSSLTIEAILENNGGAEAYPYMSLYDGLPENGGKKLGSFTYPSGDYIDAFSFMTGTITLPYHNLPVGDNILYVIADPDNSVDEISESNNTGQITLTIYDDPEIDLFISGNDITFSPPLPLEGEQVTIEATYHNSGSESVYAYIAFYSGDPAGGGQLIDRVQRWVGQESSRTVSVDFTMTNDVPEIYVVVDDNNSIQETDENNNIAFNTIDTYNVDLSVNSGDIALSPIFPQDGTSVDVNVTVHSAGIIDTAGVLSLYDGDSDSGILLGSQNFATGGNGSVTVGFPSAYMYPGNGATLTAVITGTSPAGDGPVNNSATAVFGEDIKDGSSNEGRDFWLAFPDVYYNTAKLVIQSKHYANVTVDAPSFSWTGTASPGFPALVPLKFRTLYDLENKITSDGIIEDKGIHVTSDRDVSVIFHTSLVAAEADDSYLALPVDLLGTEYYFLSYTAWGQHFPSLYVIVATEDNTNIEFNGTVINMDKGQTYQVKQDAIDHSGTYVRSDKPISFIAGARCSNVTTDPFIRYCDSILEQMLPVSMLGTDYYTAPLYSPGSPDVFRILASEDNTEISVKDRFDEENMSLNAGEWIEYEKEFETHITSNEPIMVAQFSKGYDAAGLGDPFQITIVPTEKLKEEYRYYTHPGYEDGDFLTVVAPRPDTTVMLDGGELTDGWLPLPDGGYYLLVDSTEGEHTVTADKPVAVYSHGYRLWGSYGYPGGLALPLANLALNMSVDPAAPQEGQLVNITAGLLNEGDKWAEHVLVRAYNGDPENGGVQIGEDIYLDIIYPHETATVDFPWETYGHTGMNNIYMIADPENTIKESSETDNTAMATVDVSNALKPDPSITDADITVSSQMVDEGETVTLSAKVKNRGSDAGNIPVSLYIEDPDSGGVLLESKEIFQIIPLNGEAAIDFTFSTAGFSSNSTLFVIIDPDNTIDELLEDNNTAVKQLGVHRKKISLDVETDAVQYHANSDAGINVFLRNEGTLPWSGTGEVYINDISGSQIAHVGTFTVNNLMPLGLEGWHYRVPMTVNEQEDMYEAIAIANVDFASLFASLGIDNKTPDLNSVRVLEFDGSGNLIGEKTARFEKDNDFDIAANPSGRILWLMDGATPANSPRYFYLYFDTTEKGTKPASSNTDLPENGKLIAFSGKSGDTYTIKGNGDGTFEGEVHNDTIVNSALEGIVLRDFNNDGFPDIISADNSQNIYYYQNSADGTDTYLPKVQVGTVESGIGVQDITAADYNNDGNEDFILNMQHSDLYLFLGDGEGSFVRSNIADNTGLYFRGKASADMNQDGNIDLIVGENNNGIVYVFYGNGDGTFGPPVETGNIKKEVLSYDSIYGITAGDIDGDGLNDIVINSMRGGVYLIQGAFWEPEGIVFKPMEEVSTLRIADVIGYADLDLIDINSDGNLDVMAARYIDPYNYPDTSYLLYFEGNGDGSFKPSVTIPTSSYYTTSVSASRLSPESVANIGAPEEIGSESFQFAWNTGNTLSGDYFVSVELYDTNTNLISEKSVAIEILQTGAIDANLVTDKISYYPNESVTIMSTLLNNNVNTIYEDITATVTVKDLTAQTLITENRAIGLLTPSSNYSFSAYWNTGTYPSGDYPVTLEVKDTAGNVLSVSTDNITISSGTSPFVLLTGQISVDNQSLLQGDPANINYSVTNTGNIDLSQVDLSIVTVHAVELTVYDTLTDQTALLMDATYNNVQQLDTQSYSAKDYLVILRADIAGVEETLASTYFRVEGAPSAPSLNLPAEGEDVEVLTPDLSVNNASDPNDDQLSYEFEIYEDPAMTILVASEAGIGETADTTSWTVTLELVENSRYYWRARAYDGLLYGDWMDAASFRVNVLNDPPTAPTLSSPADNSEVDTFTPVLTVNNAFDPDSENLTYNFEVALDIDFTQVVANEIGIFEGSGTTGWQVPVNLSENTNYYWRAQADDWLEEGPWMVPAGFFVNTANDAPSVPVIISPADASEVTTPVVDIIISNSTDPESDPLTYAFELDTVNTFDSPDLVTASGIAEGAGTTTWNTNALMDNTWYYVRAKASDGQAESPWTPVTAFFVNTVNDPPNVPILANPSDGGAVNVFMPELSVYNASDVDGDILTYEFELYTDAAMTTLVSSAAVIQETANITSWTVPVGLMENSTYYWRARAYDGELNSGWTALASFMVNTANDAPTAPVLESPAEGSSVDTLAPTLMIHNATDPENDVLTYTFEIYKEGTLVQRIESIPEDLSGTTSLMLSAALIDDTTYTWRASAHDGDRYGAWMDMATFTVHLPVLSINGTIDFDPNTLNKKSKGKWVVVYIELPEGYDVNDIDLTTVLLEGSLPAEPWPYAVGDEDNDGIPDLMVKFRRSDVIDILPTGDDITVHVSGSVASVDFEGIDIIRVIDQ